MMKLTRIAVLALALAGMGAAQARFIDEREAEPAAAAAAPAPGQAASAASGAAVVPAAEPVSAKPAVPEFAVTAEDKSLRETLTRWAKLAGWSHEPGHWAVDKDLPVEGTAGPEFFGADFRGAVRKLLAASELTDFPVQPCFYTNSVVRVVGIATLCSKTKD